GDPFVSRRRPAADFAVARYVDPQRLLLPVLRRVVDRGVSRHDPLRAHRCRQRDRRLGARRAEPQAALMLSNRPLLDVRNLRADFPTRRGTLPAVDDISFDMAAGAPTLAARVAAKRS